MKIYVMRHGQTDWNVERKLQGRTDIELNETGKHQVKQAQKEIEKYNIDLILCSPLKRTKQTAQIVSEGKNIEIIYRDELLERNFGDLEGKQPWKEPLFANNEFYNYTKNIKMRNIETVRELCDRVWGLLDEIEKTYSDKNVLLVTHGGTSRAISAYFNGIPEDGIICSAGLENAQIKEFQK